MALIELSHALLFPFIYFRQMNTETVDTNLGHSILFVVE